MAESFSDMLKDYLSRYDLKLYTAPFKENDKVRIEGLNDIGVIIDARPEIDTYVVEFSFSPNHVGYFKAGEMTLVNQTPVDLKGACNHDMQEYRGFSENYHYCVKCDLKDKS